MLMELVVSILKSFFAYRYQLGYTCNEYKCTKNTCAVHFSKARLWYADTLCYFTVPELFLHKIFNCDMLELYINATTTHGAQFQCYRWMKLSNLICWESMLFKCSSSLFAYRYQLGYDYNVYNCFKHTWCTISVL